MKQHCCAARTSGEPEAWALLHFGDPDLGVSVVQETRQGNMVDGQGTGQFPPQAVRRLVQSQGNLAPVVQ